MYKSNQPSRGDLGGGALLPFFYIRVAAPSEPSGSFSHADYYTNSYFLALTLRVLNQMASTGGNTLVEVADRSVVRRLSMFLEIFDIQNAFVSHGLQFIGNRAVTDEELKEWLLVGGRVLIVPKSSEDQAQAKYPHIHYTVFASGGRNKDGFQNVIQKSRELEEGKMRSVVIDLNLTGTACGSWIRRMEWAWSLGPEFAESYDLDTLPSALEHLYQELRSLS